MNDLVTVSVNNHIADVRLSRPDKLNALNMAMFKAIGEAAEAVMRDRSVRVVVLSGEGKAFCSGLDLSSFADPQMLGTDPFGPGRGGFWPNFYQRPAYIWKDVPVPVICALHGVVFGGGMQIALGADIRIAHPETRLSIMEMRWGLIPDMSASQTLRDLVGLDVAKELTFTGRQLLGDEAKSLGLVTRLEADPHAAAMVLAQTIAAQNPEAVTLAKLLFETAWHGDDAQGLALEEKLQTPLLKSPNQIEAVMAGMQKRPPVFADRVVERLDRANPLATVAALRGSTE